MWSLTSSNIPKSDPIVDEQEIDVIKKTHQKETEPHVYNTMQEDIDRNKTEDAEKIIKQKANCVAMFNKAVENVSDAFKTCQIIYRKYDYNRNWTTYGIDLYSKEYLDNKCSFRFNDLHIPFEKKVVADLNLDPTKVKFTVGRLYKQNQDFTTYEFDYNF